MSVACAAILLAATRIKLARSLRKLSFVPLVGSICTAYPVVGGSRYGKRRASASNFNP